MSNILKHVTTSVNLDKAQFFCDSRNIFTTREKFTLKDNIQREDNKDLKIKRRTAQFLPRVELVDNALKPYHSKKSACETPQPCQRKDGES